MITKRETRGTVRDDSQIQYVMGLVNALCQLPATLPLRLTVEFCLRIFPQWNPLRSARQYAGHVLQVLNLAKNAREGRIGMKMGSVQLCKTHVPYALLEVLDNQGCNFNCGVHRVSEVLFLSSGILKCLCLFFSRCKFEANHSRRSHVFLFLLEAPREAPQRLSLLLLLLLRILLRVLLECWLSQSHIEEEAH